MLGKVFTRMQKARQARKGTGETPVLSVPRFIIRIKAIAYFHLPIVSSKAFSTSEAIPVRFQRTLCSDEAQQRLRYARHSLDRCGPRSSQVATYALSGGESR
jgi:hypothetical protein